MQQRLKRLAKTVIRKTALRRWPSPRVTISEEPQFLFVITPPYSGSTALAKVLSSARGTAMLRKNGEGQWLVPGMCETDRWDPEKNIDWTSVRAVWLKRIERINQAFPDTTLIIEKSPPNAVRIDQLTETFPNHSLMAFNRDPYANSSSILHRHYRPERKTEEKRIELLSKLAAGWLFRSRWVKKWIEEREVVNFTYEQFCKDPSTCMAMLAVQVPVFETVNVDTEIKVKDYKKQGLINFNDTQISKLSPREKDAITKVLSQAPELLSFFGYHFL